ncbi:unnamed protein product [Zymoseptoria tritici ST99CH_1E4]|uniref:Uncharacterized protein n=1 Tax=Zymoseptoria tritici ST99CH_1E4 TaxID=1276532 RepID=A0A2H1G3U7_ZYMTR|nr:unnamed protein product [Zymoseptoria tritici ST99CH_1E4]
MQISQLVIVLTMASAAFANRCYKRNRFDWGVCKASGKLYNCTSDSQCNNSGKDCTPLAGTLDAHCHTDA